MIKVAHKRKVKIIEEKPGDNIKSMLLVAERCATKLNRNVKWLKGKNPQGEEQDILVILHGDKSILARQDGEHLVLFVQINMADEWKAKIKTIPDDTRKMILNQVMSILLMSKNTGFAMHPIPVKDIKDLSFFTLEQILILKETEISTINRFSDGIQELVSLTLHTMIILNTIMPYQSEPVTSTPSSPDGMYA